MFVALIYKLAGSADVDRVVGGFASHEAAAEWCSHNVPTQPFDIREVEFYEVVDGGDPTDALRDYFTGSYRPS